MSSPTSFADAMSSSSDGGASVLSEISGTSPSAPKTTPDALSESRPSSPDPDVHGRGASGSDPALSPVATGTATPTATTTQTFAPDVLAAARKSIESDPSIAPFIDLRNRMTAGDLRDALPQLQRLATDEVGFFRDLQAHLRATGKIEPETPKAPAGPAKKFEMPQPDLQNEDGSQKAYSATAMQSIVDGILTQVSPLLEDREAAQKERTERAAYDESVRTKTVTFSGQIAHIKSKHPDFEAHRAEVTQALLADMKLPQSQRMFNTNIYAAYLHVKQSKQPITEERARQTVVADLNKKAAASTARPNGRVPGGGSTERPKTFMEAMQRNPALAAAVVGRVAG